MKVYSDTLTERDLFEAATLADVELYYCEPIGNTRVRLHGWEISLAGSSPYTSQSSFAGAHKAATWNEWGVWMVELYKRDPRVRIGNYKTLADFMEQTRIISEMPGNQMPGNQQSKRAHHYQAPWLDDADLLKLQRPTSDIGTEPGDDAADAAGWR